MCAILDSDYVHLHNHTEFSRFDGLAKIDDLTLTAKLLGQKAIAITDHGNVGGWIKFYQSCKKKNKYKVARDFPIDIYNGKHFKVDKIKDAYGNVKELEITFDDPYVKPILGEEFYLARKHDVGGKEGNPDGRKGNRHILLMAKNYEGYKNICALSERSWINGQYIDPRVDLDLLAQHSKGVICSSACLGSVINNNLLHGRYEQAKKAATIFKDIYGPDFYLAAAFHGIDAEGMILSDILRLGRELDILVVAENDCHFCRKEQARYQEILMAISSSRCIKDPKRIHFPYPEFYVKSAAEMSKIFGHQPEILTNTREIADRVEDFLKTGGMRLPKFDVEEARKDAVLLKIETNQNDEEELLKKLDSILETIPENPSDEDKAFEEAYKFMCDLVQKGLLKLKWNTSSEHISLIKQELTDVRIAWESNRMDFSTYFLIVWDIINFARKEGILTGCGRGSGYASLILRALGITYGPDPVKHGLLFERFLGFDTIFFLTDNDLGLGDVVTETESNIDTEDDLDEERLVENDLGGVDRY